MAAYATFKDVETRAGRFKSLFSVAGKEPDEESIETLLENVSAELDSAITARGHDPAALSAPQKAAIVDVTAYGALARALASVPGDDVQELREYAEGVWRIAYAALMGGTHVLIVSLESGSGGSAGSFWEAEPEYDPDSAEELALSDSLSPGFAKGMSL